ncbi:MAG TPA: hypothetical protein VF981_13870 [Gemmatimonadaceae bacterium]
MRLLRRMGFIITAAVVSSAHVGSPDAWYEGAAGPYTVLVHIEAPPVVPGIAVVNVKPPESGVHRLTAFVNTYDATGGTPPPDELQPASDRPGWWRARLWVMHAGSNSVTIAVYGASGEGSVVVPLSAVAQRRLTFSAPLIALMITVAGVLFAGMLTFVGAAAREGALELGAVPDVQRHRRARQAMARAAVVIVIVLTLTGAWWRAEDRAFRERLYRPLSISTRADTSGGDARLVLTIDDSTWLRRDDVALLRARGELPMSGLVEDHGKIMHLFLIAEDGQRAMAHLHPRTADTVTFTSALPPLPAGGYRVFADIVHLNGFTQTLTSSVVVPAGSAQQGEMTDPDDSWAAATMAGADGRVHLQDGTSLTWLRDGGRAIPAGEEAGLRFAIERAAGDTASLESYLGMPGHAAVVRQDGQVFIHLHPMGTISPSAQARLSRQAAHPPAHAATAGQPPRDSLYFPYAFPAAGRYTIWVQLRRRGLVLTASFVALVE